MTSNGMIHVIDRVLKPTYNIIEVVRSNENFSILVKKLTRVSLIDTPCLVMDILQYLLQLMLYLKGTLKEF